MATKPTNEPKWATQEQIDPVSGQTNKIEPPQSYEDGGWSRREIPPRQYWNWMLWKIGQWISWLAAGTSSATASTVMERDSNGRTQVAAPSSDEDAVNKGYVDDNTSGDVSSTPDTLVRRGSSAEVNASRFKDAETPGDGDFDSDNLGYWEDIISLNGDFLIGELRAVRIGPMLNLTSTVNLEGGGTSSTLNSATGAIPSWARPNDTVSSVAPNPPNGYVSLDVDSDGTFRIAFFNYDGTSTSPSLDNETHDLVTISYNV